jgi:hypothetical protein
MAHAFPDRPAAADGVAELVRAGGWAAASCPPWESPTAALDFDTQGATRVACPRCQRFVLTRSARVTLRMEPSREPQRNVALAPHLEGSLDGAAPRVVLNEAPHFVHLFVSTNSVGLLLVQVALGVALTVTSSMAPGFESPAIAPIATRRICAVRQPLPERRRSCHSQPLAWRHKGLAVPPRSQAWVPRRLVGGSRKEHFLVGKHFSLAAERRPTSPRLNG